MNVLLIRSQEYASIEPLGLMYLAAYVRQRCACKVRILDLCAKIGLYNPAQEESLESVLRTELDSHHPDLVGISSMFTLYSRSLHDIAKIIKKIKRDVLIIAGGAHASSFYEEVLEDANIDAVVKGEGEAPLAEIVNSLKAKTDISLIRGLIIKKNGSIMKNEPSPFIKNLDTIPHPARNLVDMDVYLKDRYSCEHAMRSPRAGIASSRGCPFNCIYCAVHSVWERSYRARGPENVADEISYLINTYRVREIAFWDDNMTYHKKRTIAICDEILRRKIDVRWCAPNGVGIMTLDKEMLVKMKKSGCYKLTFGIETGSTNTQKFIRKEYIDFKKAKEIIRFCNKIGIWTHSSFIIGFPYETEDDIMKTIHYAMTSGLDMATFFVACPYPGTELYDIYKKEGLFANLANEHGVGWHSSIDKPAYNTKYFTASQLELYRDYATRRMFTHAALSFIHPFHVLPKVTGRDEIKYFAKMFSVYGERFIRMMARTLFTKKM